MKSKQQQPRRRTTVAIPRLLGSDSAIANPTGASPSSRTWSYVLASKPNSVNSGAQFQLLADQGPSFAGGKDTVGYRGTGCKITDYLSSNFLADYDYFRFDKVEYLVSLSEFPKNSTANVLVYASIDYDSATINSFDEVYARPNKVLVNLTPQNPSQTILSFAPRRRISGNVDPSLQVTTKPGEWCDVAYAANHIFGNIKFVVVVPAGQEQHPSPADPASVLVTTKAHVTFMGRIGV